MSTSDVDSDDPKPKPSAAGWREEEDGGTQRTGREGPVSPQAVDSERYHTHTPVVERIDPQIGANVAGDYASKGHLGKDSPPKGKDTLERIFQQITFEGDTYASDNESSRRRAKRYSISASLSRSGSKVTPSDVGVASSQDAEASAKTPLLEPHVPDTTRPPPHVSPPPSQRENYLYPHSDSEIGGATRTQGSSRGRGWAEKHAKGRGEPEKQAKGQDYGAIQENGTVQESGGESGVPRHGLRIPRTQEVQHAVVPQLPRVVGRPPQNQSAGVQANQQGAVAPDPPRDNQIFFPIRSRAEKCRCYCVLYTVLFTVVCSAVIVVWSTAISPSKRPLSLVTSLDEIMKVDANSFTTGLLTLHHDADSSGVESSTGVMTTYHVPCNQLRQYNSTTDPIPTPDMRVNRSQNNRLGLTHHVFYIEEGGTVNITACINFTASTAVEIEFFVFKSIEYMKECENQNCDCSYGSEPPCLDDFIVRIDEFSNTGSHYYNATVTGHHYMVTSLGADLDVFPFNLSFQFVVATLKYNVSGIAENECRRDHLCKVRYTWFPWEIFHRSCVLLQISGTSHDDERYSILFPIQQTSHRRNDMIGYFVAFIAVTLTGLFLAYSCPIYRATKDCLQHGYTRRARRYFGLY